MKTPSFIRYCCTALLLLSAPMASQADIITLNAIEQSITVGLNDTDAGTAPAAPGDGWFSGAHAGTLRGRATTQFQLRTQWYFVLDDSALASVNPSDITSVSLSIPQIGRLNTVSATPASMHLYDPNFTWDTGGSNYPVFNGGRTAGQQAAGYPGGTALASPLGGYNDHGLVTDTSNPDVEGSFIVSNAALLATVQSWATDPANNEGFFVTYENGHNIGLAFGTPTLTITTIPEPGTLVLLFIGLATATGLRRKHRRLEA